jgi:hypothetical protein
MSMHLEGPWLTTIGKRKGKQKFRSAEEARRSRELAESWQQKQKEWKKLTPKFSTRSVDSKKESENSFPKYHPPPGREILDIPSRADTPGRVAARPADKIYTGTAVAGIVVQHKSCLQPVFSIEEAKDSAKMRR